MTSPAISRRSDVVSRVERDETLVLDLATQTAHCLSGDVALVWASTETSTGAIGAATGLSADAVEDALKVLRDIDLVAVPSGLSRRTLMARTAAVSGAVIAAGAISLPLPASANASSAKMTLARQGACGVGSVATLVFTVSPGHLGANNSYSFPSAYYIDNQHKNNAGHTSGTVTVTVTTGTGGVITGASVMGAAASVTFTGTSVTYTTTLAFGGVVDTNPAITGTSDSGSISVDATATQANACV